MRAVRDGCNVLVYDDEDVLMEDLSRRFPDEEEARRYVRVLERVYKIKT